MVNKIVAIGDCNTLGAGRLENDSYPNRFSSISGIEVLNVGHTMATTREGKFLLQEFIDDADCIFIQFGLVDSYKTFKYSPYVLYYPDNFLRKHLRSIVKKYKKVCKKIGLNKVAGEKNVIAIEEYRENIQAMIEVASPRTVVLLDTVPNKKIERNGEIQRYNKVLSTLSSKYSNCIKINLFDLFESNFERFYMDDTHCNAEGYDRIARILHERINLLS